MSGFLFKFDRSDVNRALAAVYREGRSAAVTKALQKPLRDDQAAHAKEQEGPEGRWQPRAQATIERARQGKSRRRVKGPNRRLLNTLPRRTIKVKSTPRGLTAYSKVPWSGVHQHGGVVGRGARIPARPFLWFSPEFLERALVIIRGRLLFAWRRG